MGIQAKMVLQGVGREKETTFRTEYMATGLEEIGSTAGIEEKLDLLSFLS